MAAAKNRALPIKESTLFKSVLKHFETKQYKKGLKAAEQILKRFPEHGETLAMKGLFYNSMDRKEEGYDLVKKGLRFDLTSHICWHVFGLLYRSDKNYEEAIKCYRNALRYDKENLQILRDFALLQIQLRNYEALRESRHTLLQLNPRMRQNWVALAMSYHLLGDYNMADSVLTSYEETLKVAPKANDYEHSEMLLYHNLVIEESGDYQKALDHLEGISRTTCDNRAIREKRAIFLSELGKNDEAESAWRNLVHENPECHAYFVGLQRAKGLSLDSGSSDSTTEAKLMALYDELAAKYPRSNAVQRLPLKYATGDAFVERATAYLTTKLRKGVPSLFVDIKTLYADETKQKQVQEVILKLIGQMETPQTNGHSHSVVEPPTAYLWALYFLAQHYDFTHQTEEALAAIDKAIEHTPTLVELYMTKARILKHAGDIEAASAAMNEARELDLQDRFINSKCSKYLLRNDKVEEAEKTMGLFTRTDAVSPLMDLNDMQAIWFLLEEADSYNRQGKYGLTLKRLNWIEKHFSDFTEDQFDFHTYCLRKNTLRSYLRMLRFEDQLLSHLYFVRAAQRAVEIYIRLHDEPQLADGINDPDFASLSEAEQKKIRKKARKAELKSTQDTRSDAQKKEDSKVKETKKKDDDPEGVKLLKTADPLGDAMKFLQPCLDMAGNNIDIHLMAYDVFIRRKKYLLALKSLVKSHSINSKHPKVNLQIVHFSHVLSQKPELHPTTRKVIEEQVSKLKPTDQSLEDFIQASTLPFIPHVLSAAKAHLILDPSAKDKSEALLLGTMDSKYASTRTLQDTIEVYNLLKRLKSPKLDDFRTTAAKWYPRATHFR